MQTGIPPAAVPAIPNYNVIKLLGQGGCGKAYQVERSTDRVNTNQSSLPVLEKVLYERNHV